MRSQTTPDQRLAELARRQFGVVSRAQLYTLGFDNPAVERRIAAGRLHRLYRGVYSVGHALVPPRGRWLAAVLACGDGAVLSHRSAAAHWGMRPTSAPKVDVTVPRTSGVRSSARIAVHRPRDPAERLVRDGIPVTTPGRTLADLATALPRRQIEKAAETAEALKLRVEIPPDHPGAKRLAEILDGYDLGTDTKSDVEDEFLALCDAYGIPRPRVNTLVEGFLVDFCWPEERLIVETDGRRHLTRAAFERDRAQDAFLTACGWRVMRFTTRQVRGEPETVAARVVSARSPLLATP
jgi:hypothetical protein